MAQQYLSNYTGQEVDSAIEAVGELNTNLYNHINNNSNPHNVTQAQVGLGNVDNTSDLDKPISSAVAAALATKASVESIETIENIAQEALNSAQEATSIAQGRSKAQVFETQDAMNAWLAIPENVATLQVGDNLFIEDTSVPDYWWNGTQPVELESGSVSLTDYYNKSQVDSMLAAKASTTDLQSHIGNYSNPHQVTQAQVGLSNVNNTSDMDKPISTAVQAALDDLTPLSVFQAAETSFQSADAALTQNLNQEIQNREDAINEVNEQIGSLASTLSNAVLTTAQQLSSEQQSQARANINAPAVADLAQYALNTAVSAEESARQTADEELQTQITANASAIAAKANSSALNQETQNRQNADLTLQNNIDSEVTARESGDSNLQTQITQHISNVSNPHQVTAAQVGLGNVDNTSDANKPISTATQAALDSKVGNSGKQSITGSLTIVKEGDSSGNLVVQGNLTVQGTTVTESAETLAVKDNLIITNSDGATLTDFSGLAIRTDSTNVYGIVYDPVHDSVDLGLGQLDTTNNFTFNDGEGYPVAIRDYSSNFTDGHIIAWDAVSRKLVDGGPKQQGGLTSIEPLTIGDVVYDGTTPQTVTVSDIGAEPAFTKNTAFNKNFGTAAGTVMQGNDSRVTSAVQSVTFAGAALTKSGTALSITQSDARTALGLGSAAYSDASSFATQTQGSNADTALAATQTNASAIQNIVNGTTTVGNATNAVNANTATSATTASTASNATNVTTNINGKAISSIFESDGVTVKKATTATSATSATTATSANTATSATKATQDGNGNVITSTYATIAQLNTTNTNVTNASNKATPLTITESTGNTSGSTGHTHSLTLTKSWLATDLNADSSNVLVLYGGNANGTW